jgi:hypothetical protein
LKYGSCERFEADPVKTASLGHYLEFLK